MARNRYFEDEALEAKFNGKMILRILSYIKPYKKQFITIAVFMTVLGAVSLLPSFFNRVIIDKILDASNRVPYYITLAAGIIIAWVLVAVSDILFNFVKTRVLTKNAYNAITDLRGEVFRHLQKLSFDYFDSRPAGKILVRVTSYVDELANILSGAVVGFITDSVKTLLILIFLYILDYRFALIITAAIIPLGFAITFLRAKIHLRWRILRNKHSNRTAYIAENINGIAVTKAFNRADLNCQIYDELNKESYNSWVRVVRLNEIFLPTMDFFWNIGQFGIYLTAYLIAINFGSATLSPGLLVSFIGYLGLFGQPLNNISTYVQQLSNASSNLERIFETMDTPPSIYDREGAYDLPPIQGHVKFENVSFAYEKDNFVLENFNLDVPASKTIALVGPTGAGKTTIVNLLSRFYEVSSGRILIDGHDINNVTLHSLRSQVCVMMQDSFVFSGTIMENIRYARPDAADEECIKAAKTVNLHEYVMQYPDGYNHYIGEKGAGLSSGEIQLLSFARAVLCDPKILILDEATSSVDTQTESKIQEALEKTLKGRTSFIIAHRLSTIRKADCILYISNKGILEAGSHEELMAKKGAYYELQTKN
ncbi:MAG TPA: ABC transporter ATP-binding protein [Clostridia bacterium]